MPSSSDHHDAHDAHDYAERVCGRLPRRLQDLRERAGLSKYGLARESGLSRSSIGKLERGVASPTIPGTAQLRKELLSAWWRFSPQENGGWWV